MEEVRELAQQLAQKVRSCCERRDFDRARHWLSKATAVAERSQDLAIDNCVAEACSTLAKHVARAAALASHPAAREAQRIEGCKIVTRTGDNALNLYSVFQVERNATLSEVKSAYKRLSLILHPDKAGDVPAAAAAFQTVSAGFGVLKTPLLREAHDARIDGETMKAEMLEARQKRIDRETNYRDEQADQKQMAAREAAAAAAAAREASAAAREAAATAAPAAAPQGQRPPPASGTPDTKEPRVYPHWHVVGARVLVRDKSGARLRGTLAEPQKTPTQHRYCWVRLDADGYVHGFPWDEVSPLSTPQPKPRPTPQPKRPSDTRSTSPPSKRPRASKGAKKKPKRKPRMLVDDSSDEASFTDCSDTDVSWHELPPTEPEPKPAPAPAHEPTTAAPKTHKDHIQALVDKYILAEDVGTLKKFVRLVPSLTVLVQDLAKNRGKICVPLAQVLAHETVEVAEKMLKYYVASARAAVVAENELSHQIKTLEARKGFPSWCGETESTVTELYNALDTKINVAVMTGLKDTSSLFTKAAAMRYDLKMQIFKKSA